MLNIQWENCDRKAMVFSYHHQGLAVWHFFSIIRGKEWMHSQVFSSQFFSILGHTEFMASQPCHLPMHIQVISLSRCTAVFVVDQKRDYPTVSAIFCSEMFEILRRQKDQTGRGRVVQDFRLRETTIPLVGLKLQQQTSSFCSLFWGT